MPKDILIYGRIDEWNARLFFDSIAEAQELDETAELMFRINTGGGEPEYGWGIAAKIQELVNKKVKVDGKAYSWGAVACCYAEDVECLDVSQFMIHRASYSEWFESSDYFTEPLQENLAAINKKIETAFRNKIDVEAFENLKQVKDKGITIKDIFSMEGRIDVFFSAADAKKIKLVKNIVQLTPSKKAEIESYKETAKASRNGERVSVEKTKTEEPLNQNIMDLNELKSKYPAIYAEAKAEGHKEGVAAELDRCMAAAEFIDVDPEGVKKVIESGKPMGQAAMAAFMRKSMSTDALKKVEKDSEKVKAATEETPAGEKGEKEKKTAAFEGEVDKSLGLKKTA